MWGYEGRGGYAQSPSITAMEKSVLENMDGIDPDIAEEELKDKILGNMSAQVGTFITRGDACEEFV
jgi:hypothetical protein